MATPVLVEFVEVGARNQTWTAQVKELSERELYKAVKAKGVLGSRDIDFTADASETSGGIFVGMFRKVGAWRLVAKAEGSGNPEVK